MRVFAYKKLKAILDLETIVCLMRTLYGEIEIHATQCQQINQLFARLLSTRLTDNRLEKQPWFVSLADCM